MTARLEDEDGSARCLLGGLQGASYIDLVGGAVIVSVCLCGESGVREEGEVIPPGWGSDVGCCFVFIFVFVAVIVVVFAVVLGAQKCRCDAVGACSCDCLD